MKKYYKNPFFSFFCSLNTDLTLFVFLILFIYHLVTPNVYGLIGIVAIRLLIWDKKRCPLFSTVVRNKDSFSSSKCLFYSFLFVVGISAIVFVINHGFEPLEYVNSINYSSLINIAGFGIIAYSVLCLINAQSSRLHQLKKILNHRFNKISAYRFNSIANPMKLDLCISGRWYATDFDNNEIINTIDLIKSKNPTARVLRNFEELN